MMKTRRSKWVSSVVVLLLVACAREEDVTLDDASEVGLVRYQPRIPLTAAVESASTEAVAIQSAESEQTVVTLVQVGQIVVDDLAAVVSADPSGWAVVRPETPPEVPECRTVIVDTDFDDFDAPECCATNAGCDPLCDLDARWNAFVAAHRDGSGNLVAHVKVIVDYDMCSLTVNGEPWTVDGRYTAVASILIPRGAVGSYGDFIVSLNGSNLDVGITFGTPLEAWTLSCPDNPQTAETDETKTITVGGSSTLELSTGAMTLGFSGLKIAVDDTSIEFDGTVASTKVENTSTLTVDGTVSLLGTATVEDIEIDQDCDPRASVVRPCTILIDFTFQSVTVAIVDVQFSAIVEEDMKIDISCPSTGDIQVAITGNLHADVYDGTVEEGEVPILSYDLANAGICAGAVFSSSESSCTVEVSNYTDAASSLGRLTLACTDDAIACRSVTIDSSFDPEEDIQECTP